MHEKHGPGFIYVMRLAESCNLFKLGYSKHPITRAEQLDNTSRPAPLHIYRVWQVDNMLFAEQVAHARLKGHRYSFNREYFEVFPSDSLDFSQFHQQDYDATSEGVARLSELIEDDFGNHNIQYHTRNIEDMVNFHNLAKSQNNRW